ncbi:DNA primase [Catellatospora tritici]|uniref:DNA primase n=1 Tax=Catellatospora tritici TaxID=2851566 RepID=UPI001C2DDD86|nr:DNA primase [Catellatospora tritici]MBV1849143.1 DNA primase [Catellatospora tritici]
MADTLWDEYEVSPVEIALPGGKVGMTLRAYRPASALTPTDVSDREDDDDVFADHKLRRPIGLADEEELPEFQWTKEALDEVAAAPAEDEVAERVVEAAEAEEAEESAAEADLGDEEVPVFLSHKGKLLLFASAKGLADFVRSNAPHDLKQLDGWAKLAKKVKAEDVVAGDEDAYELDLVVENLRGGPDAWDPELLLRAGEIARDISYALRLKPVIVSLSPGSPLDDLDEALRATEEGGLGSFFAKRKLRKIGAEQASIGWRSIIGKISGAVDWRD